MKTYLKLTVTYHDGWVAELACTAGNSAVIGVLATIHKSILVEETSINEEEFKKLNLLTVSELCD